MPTSGHNWVYNRKLSSLEETLLIWAALLRAIPTQLDGQILHSNQETSFSIALSQPLKGAPERC
jgi:hypothetical protein